MNKDKTIRMAREAGFVIDEASRQYQPNCISHTHYLIDEPLTRFAALVAAAERQRNLEMVQILVEAEREACAKVCDLMEQQAEGTECCKWPTPIDCAAAIRARGEK